ncbi:MAG: NADH-quinone oxidoreductase subunit C [Chthonomonadetes bacterium]|nr:NADH-quinone oxidoreductase subunit C [Chthonomonadetes bacterium]
MGEAHTIHAELPDIENVQVVPKEQLLERVAQLAEQGHRFITTTCIDNGERFEVYYHFDRQLAMTHLQVTIDRDAPLPSITPIYFCAFVAENEMKDLFGLRIDGLMVDYQGRMLVSDELPTPPMRKSDARRNGDGS